MGERWWRLAQQGNPTDVAVGSAAERQDVGPSLVTQLANLCGGSMCRFSEGASASAAIRSVPLAGDLATDLGVVVG